MPRRPGHRPQPRASLQQAQCVGASGAWMAGVEQGEGEFPSTDAGSPASCAQPGLVDTQCPQGSGHAASVQSRVGQSDVTVSKGQEN